MPDALSEEQLRALLRDEIRAALLGLEVRVQQAVREALPDGAREAPRRRPDWLRNGTAPVGKLPCWGSESSQRGREQCQSPLSIVPPNVPMGTAPSLTSVEQAEDIISHKKTLPTPHAVSKFNGRSRTKPRLSFQSDNGRGKSKRSSVLSEGDDTPELRERNVAKATQILGKMINPASLIRSLHKNDSDSDEESITNDRLQAESSPGQQRLRRRFARIVKSRSFDLFVSAMIMMNALSFGIEANYVAKNLSDQKPMMFGVVQTAFTVLYVFEMAARIIVYGKGFFTTPKWIVWNWLDLSLVALQVAEEFVNLLHISEAQVTGNSAIVRVLRLLRLLRVVRFVRIFRLLREMRALISSIANSLKSLGWAVFLLAMVIYSIGLYTTELVAHRRIDGGKLSAQTVEYFGTLESSMLSLIEAIFGGVDWGAIARTLGNDLSPLMLVMFVFYVGFAIMVLMNVVTGVFLESVVKSTQANKDIFLVENAREIFKNVNGGLKDGKMNFEEFMTKIHTRAMQDFFQGIDVDPEEAKVLFHLLDVDGSGVLSAEEFLCGSMRLRGPTKSLETALLSHDVRMMRRQLQKHLADARRPDEVGGVGDTTDTDRQLPLVIERSDSDHSEKCAVAIEACPVERL